MFPSVRRRNYEVAHVLSLKASLIPLGDITPVWGSNIAHRLQNSTFRNVLTSLESIHIQIWRDVREDLERR